MDDEKRAVLVAALSAYAELLSKNTTDLDNHQFKGKSKASEDDVDLEAEIRGQIQLCGELKSSFLGASTSATQPDNHQSWMYAESGSGGSNKRAQRLAGHQQSIRIAEEPCIDPFTGRPIFQETGFEAGPSTRPPAALLHSASEIYEVPLLDTSARWIAKPLLDQDRNSKQLPGLPLGKDGVTPSSLAYSAEQQQDQGIPNRVMHSMDNAAGGPVQTKSIIRKPLPDQHKAYYLQSNNANAIEEPTLTSPIHPVRKETLPSYNTHNPDKRGNKNIPDSGTTSFTSYLHHITSLASTAMKTAGNIISVSKENSAPNLRSPHSASGAHSHSTVSHTSQTRQVRRPPSLESLPPAYDTLQPISHHTSLSLISSVASSSVVTSSSEGDSISILSENKDASIGRRILRCISWRASSKNTRPSLSPTELPKIARSRQGSKSTPLSTIHEPSFELPPAIPSSRNAAKYQLTADEAFARSLAEEELQDAQMERDALLAFALANGTADEDDIALGYFVARESKMLIESTNPRTERLPTLFDVPEVANRLEKNEEAFSLHPDMIKARIIQRQLDEEDEALSANLAVAMMLQADFDLDAESEDAWESWKKANVEECIICGEEQHREELLRPCDHGWCESCLQDGFKNGLSSRKPLSCCKGNLDIQVCTGLEDKFVHAYEEMMLEVTSANPIYCFHPRCGKFLPPQVWVGEVASCLSCKQQTCKFCRQKSHPGTFCPEDTETAAVKELGKRKGWKVCPGCRHLIERSDGCLHMICSRCQTAFCYRCSKRWKDCESTCPDAISATHPKY